MIRNLKALMLALVAVLAMSAMAASSASAAKFTSVGEVAQELHAVDVGEADKFVTATGSTLTCLNETFTANAPIAPTTELSFTPDWKDCKTEGAAFNNVTVTHNGCNLVFTSETAPKVNEVHITCPPGKVIEVHHYSSTANHTSGIASCTETIAAQTPTILTPIQYTNITPGVEVHGKVRVNVNIHGGPCSFGFPINTTAEYTFSDFVTGTKGHIHVK